MVSLFVHTPGDHCLASVSAIVDEKGGYRVVIAKPDQLHHHIQEGERAYTVPDYWVWEPVPWDLLPTVAGVAERYLARMTNRYHELKP